MGGAIGVPRLKTYCRKEKKYVGVAVTIETWRKKNQVGAYRRFKGGSEFWHMFGFDLTLKTPPVAIDDDRVLTLFHK